MTDDQQRPASPSRTVRVSRVGERERSGAAEDRVAVEAPLQVLVSGQPFAVIMRTPGDDEALAAGFLFSESVIAGREDIAAIASGRTGAGRDCVSVTLAPHLTAPPAEGLRRVAMNASCGLCGRVSVESIDVERPPIEAAWRISAALVAALPGRLRDAQQTFDETGGLHASGLFDLEGVLQSCAEDVGRHNALDKVVGRALLEGALPLSRTVLVVSGRSSFEIVQKALLAGIPFVAAVSAPSSLAVDLAEAGGITLAGFVRGGGFNVYAHPERVS